MIIILKNKISESELNNIFKKLVNLGLQKNICYSHNKKNNIIVIFDNISSLIKSEIKLSKGVIKIIPIETPYKLASRKFQATNTTIHLSNGTIIGGTQIILIAGPCTVESEKQTISIAKSVKKSGAQILRGGAFKPRSSPYSFQGYGEKALKFLLKAKLETNLAICTEVMDTRDVELVYNYADILQIGTRNMQNINLLKEVGKINKPIMLKRSVSSTIEEWLMSAEYIMSEGNKNVILCERGIKTFETSLRNTMDISSIPLIKNLSHLPIIVDPSHACGSRKYIPSLSKAAIAVGSDGLLIEVHNNPEKALVDGAQSMFPLDFKMLIPKLKNIAKSIDRFI